MFVEFFEASPFSSPRGGTDAATRGRYPDLVAGLGTSGMPDAATEKIVASLNAEPAPAADPLVTLLLETAGELGMLGGLPGEPRQRRPGPNRRVTGQDPA